MSLLAFVALTIGLLCCLYVVSELVLWQYFRRKRRFLRELDRFENNEKEQ
mgnify:CR=1 FL=1